MSSRLLTLCLYVSGYGFNSGSTLTYNKVGNYGLVGAAVAANTSLAATCGAMSALFSNLYYQERKTGEYNFDLTMAMNGALSGLVAITAACGSVEYWAAILIGVVAGWLYLFGSKLLIRLQLDDAVDAIPVHMLCGIWGLLATGLFSSPERTQAVFGQSEHVGWFYSLARGGSDATLLANQVILIIFIFGWVMLNMTPFFLYLNYMGWFRVDSLEELVGLDMSYHGNSHGGEDEIKTEYLNAYNRKRLQRRRSGTGLTCPDNEEASWCDLTTGDELHDTRSVKSGVSGVSNASGDDDGVSEYS